MAKTLIITPCINNEPVGEYQRLVNDDNIDIANPTTLDVLIDEYKSLAQVKLAYGSLEAPIPSSEINADTDVVFYLKEGETPIIETFKASQFGFGNYSLAEFQSKVIDELTNWRDDRLTYRFQVKAIESPKPTEPLSNSKHSGEIDVEALRKYGYNPDFLP